MQYIISWFWYDTCIGNILYFGGTIISVMYPFTFKGLKLAPVNYLIYSNNIIKFLYLISTTNYACKTVRGDVFVRASICPNFVGFKSGQHKVDVL